MQQRDTHATHLPDIATVAAIASTGDRHISITATLTKVYAGQVTFRQWHLAAKHQWMEIIVDCVLAKWTQASRQLQKHQLVQRAKATRVLSMLDGALAQPTVLAKPTTHGVLMIARVACALTKFAHSVESVRRSRGKWLLTIIGFQLLKNKVCLLACVTASKLCVCVAVGNT